MSSPINRYKDAAEWTQRNLVLRSGEFGLEEDTGKVKQGDGTTKWNSLPYLDVAPYQLPLSSYEDRLSDTALDAVYGEWHELEEGEDAIPRFLATASVNIGSSVLQLVYFTARKSQPVSRLAIHTRGTAATTTSFARMALYKAESDGEITERLCMTPSDGTLLGGTFSTRVRNVEEASEIERGERYAFGLLWVGTGTPALYGLGSGADHLSLPVYFATVTGQSVLPDLVPAASLVKGGSSIFGKVLP